MDKKKAIIESVLFTMGESVEITRLAEVIDSNVKKTKELLVEMQAEYKVPLKYAPVLPRLPFLHDLLCTSVQRTVRL